MTDTSKLTSEQVADFERRAAAGEKPVLEWDDSTDSSLSVNLGVFDGEAVIAHGEGCTRFPPDRERNPRLRYYLSNVSDKDFRNHVAAQLAAEALLKEATRALHEAEIMAAGKWQETAEQARKIQQLLDRIGELETWQREHRSCIVQILACAIASGFVPVAGAEQVRYVDAVRWMRKRIEELDAFALRTTQPDVEHAKRVTELESALIQERADHARTAWARSRFTNDSEPEDGAIQHYVWTDVGGDKVNRWELVHEDEEGNTHWTEMGMGPTPTWTDEARRIVDAAMARKEGGNG